MRHILPTTLSLLSALAGSARAAEMDYNRDIRPLFSQHCTACHGGVKAAGGISFVYREKALAKGKSGAVAIVPGKPEDSELIRRITTDNLDDLMPQPDHGPRLSAAEVEKLRAWIQQGAPWSEHWAFVPPVEPADPTLKNPGWATGKADRLVLARIESAGLAPSPAATPAEWLRRVSLDLTGLPPTPEEYEAFVADTASGARERVVDRLLASPHYGERWATVWLDLARYSDTYGYEKDPHREIWPWRDWVIRAFNDDMPFDRFTVRQLAGDLLPNATTDDLLATAFHRNTQNNTEGGTDDEEYRTAAVLDRVATSWTTWNATTFGCVQCHSHPYDPIPHADYYRFAAFFDNTEDSDLDNDFPRLRIPGDPAKKVQAAALHREARARRESLNTAGLAPASGAWNPLVPAKAATSGGELKIRPDGQVDASGTQPIGVVYTLELPAPAGATALRLQILPDSDDPKKWPERGSVLSHLTLDLVLPSGTSTPVRVREVVADYLAGPYDPRRTLDGDPAGFGGYPVLTGPRWCVAVLEKPLPADAGAHLKVMMKQGAAYNSNFQGTPIRHFRWSASTDARWTALAHDAARAEQFATFDRLQGELGKLGGPEVPVMVERADSARRDTRVFVRGNRLDRDVSVQPGLPDVMNPPRKEGRLSRLDYAEWLVSDQNPLTARVLANRLWAELFGHGIVETLEDFGTSGARPSNPALLDHLALRLRGELKWSVKAALREWVLSSTYAQTAKASPDLAARDPGNLLLARGPRNRLTAEMVRDQGLVVSGLLAPTLFGPPVYPLQPDGIWSSVYSGASWKTSEGENRHRRAIYTYHKRTSGYPGFLTFDAPTRDACSARRVATNTPLQALVTLNDAAHLDMARGLAGRMEKASADPRERIAFGCRQITLGPPPAALVDTLLRLHEASAADFRADPANAAKLGSSPENAALVLVANTLLNLDGALVR